MQHAYQTITLPSQGLLYDDQVPEGQVEIRKMTTSELTRLEGGSGNVGDRLNLIIDACLKLPNAYDPTKLLIVDRMAALLSLRAISFSPSYDYQYRCSQCGASCKATCDILEDLELKEPVGGVIEPVSITLPDEEKTVELRFLRGEDEKRILKVAKRLKMQSNDASDESGIYRIALQIVSVDGQTDMPISARELFVKHLSAADNIRIRNAIDDAEPGIDTRLYPTCRSCGADNEVELPFTGEFFRPSRL